MSGSFFAGSYGGDVSAVAPTARLECRICWYVFDPEIGDESRQIPAGTPFAGLPDDWSCPICSGDRTGFMVIAE